MLYMFFAYLNIKNKMRFVVCFAECFAKCENQTAVKESSRKSEVPGTFLFWWHDLFAKKVDVF
jgi:hypothetical protein